MKETHLLFFDEVQTFPFARQAIKLLVKDHRYDYIETSSLISTYENVKDILIPNEEQRIQISPMDYYWSISESATYEIDKEGNIICLPPYLVQFL